LDRRLIHSAIIQRDKKLLFRPVKNPFNQTSIKWVV